jgi:diguanylate cyclase (GGDEF)-like protein
MRIGFKMFATIGCGTVHDRILIALAISLCIVICFISVIFLSRAQSARDNRKSMWIVATAIAFGSSVWTLHSLAMLPLRPTPQFLSDPLHDFYSVLIAFAGTCAALLTREYYSRLLSVNILGGIILGGTIGSMHFDGLAEMHASGAITLAMGHIGISLVAGTIFAAIGLVRANDLSSLRRKFEVTGYLTTGIIALHFIGIATITTPSHPAMVGLRDLLSLGPFLFAMGSIFIAVAIVRADSRPRCTATSVCALPGFAGVNFDLLQFASASGSHEIPAYPVILNRVSAARTETSAPIPSKSENVDAQIFTGADGLTGLNTRRHLLTQLQLSIDRAKISNGKIAVYQLDLDRFKTTNDLLGHEGGDIVLTEVARRLKQLTEASGMIARVAGDEFAIFDVAGSDTQTLATAARINRTLAKPFYIGGEDVVIGASIGIAVFPMDASNADELLRNAEKAMWRAKQTARGTVCRFDAATDCRTYHLRVIEQELRRAISREQLEVHYQPIFDRNADVIGAEALVRWTHPELGSVEPSDFMPVAEEAGLISDIGAWVLETACRFATSWPASWRLAVNVSPFQFSRPDYVEKVAQIIARSSFDSSRVELEITENALIGDTKRVAFILSALKEGGIHLSLDDFGTGYSSLSYLHQLRFEKIKIDRSFVSQLGTSADADSVVRAIVALGHGIGALVTAEGVETQAQRDVLLKSNCNQFQGYLFAKPMPEDAFRDFVSMVETTAGRSNPWPCQADAHVIAQIEYA